MPNHDALFDVSDKDETHETLPDPEQTKDTKAGMVPDMRTVEPPTRRRSLIGGEHFDVMLASSSRNDTGKRRDS